MSLIDQIYLGGRRHGIIRRHRSAKVWPNSNTLDSDASAGPGSTPGRDTLVLVTVCYHPFGVGEM